MHQTHDDSAKAALVKSHQLTYIGANIPQISRKATNRRFTVSRLRRFFDRLSRNAEMRRMVEQDKQPLRSAARRVYRDIYYL